MDAWSKVNAAVHAKGGLTALQLWHTGRISHRSLQPDGEAPVAPSAIQADSRTNIRAADGSLVREQCDTRARWKCPSWPTSWKTTAAPPTTRAAPASTWWKSTAPTAIC